MDSQDTKDAALFDLLEECIYIIDAHTYELLFMNRWSMRVFHVSEPGQYLGRKCYEVLRHNTHCCEGCGAEKNHSYESCQWSCFNPYLGRYYQAKDHPMRFLGHEARLEMAVDITEQMRQKHELQNAIEAEMALTEAVHILYATTDFSEALDRVLRYIGGYLQTDRAYAFELQDGALCNTHEWCRDGVFPMMAVRNQMKIPLFQRWRAVFQQRAVVVVSDVAKLQPDAPEEYTVMKQQQVSSYVEAPLHVNGRLVGFLGLDNPPADSVKHVGSIMRTLTYFVTVSMGMSKSKRLLEQLSYSDAMTGVANRNAFMRDVQDYSKAEAPCGVIYFDLNGLKRVNDDLGHKAWDRVIIHLAQVLVSFFHATEIYRTGGDEFVVICSGIKQPEFQQRVQQTVTYIRQSTPLKVSVGHSWCERGRKLQKAIVDADAAMYSEKKKYYSVHADHGSRGNTLAALY